jgi:CheY-like chemotaxis protein
MKEFFTVPYVDDSTDHQSSFQEAVIRTETPLHVQAFLSAPPAMIYLYGDPPFENKKIYPLPAFLLCSDHLNDTDSSDLVTGVRALSMCAHLPIIMLGEYANDEASAVKCYAAGADHFLHKPRTQHRFDAVVKTLYACAALHPPSFDKLNGIREHHGCSSRP